MVDPLTLWLPVLVSAVIVFVASSIIHMAFSFWHKSDYPKLEKQDQVMDLLRPLAIPPGDYFLPRGESMADMKTPEFTEKMNKGPVMMLRVLPNGPMGMGQSLILWFVYSIAIGCLAAYVAGHTLPQDAGYRGVFRIVGVVAFTGYTAALWQMAIWYKRPWLTTIKATVDGAVYAALTAGTFGWLWPR